MLIHDLVASSHSHVFHATVETRATVIKIQRMMLAQFAAGLAAFENSDPMIQALQKASGIVASQSSDIELYVDTYEFVEDVEHTSIDGTYYVQQMIERIEDIVVESKPLPMTGSRAEALGTLIAEMRILVAALEAWEYVMIDPKFDTACDVRDAIELAVPLIAEHDAAANAPETAEA